MTAAEYRPFRAMWNVQAKRRVNALAKGLAIFSVSSKRQDARNTYHIDDARHHPNTEAVTRPSRGVFQLGKALWLENSEKKMSLETPVRPSDV